jgi:hypothetical protein
VAVLITYLLVRPAPAAAPAAPTYVVGIGTRSTTSASSPTPHTAISTNPRPQHGRDPLLIPAAVLVHSVHSRSILHYPLDNFTNFYLLDTTCQLLTDVPHTHTHIEPGVYCRSYIRLAPVVHLSTLGSAQPHTPGGFNGRQRSNCQLYRATVNAVRLPALLWSFSERTTDMCIPDRIGHLARTPGS